MVTELEGGMTATAVGGRFGWSSHPLSGPQKVVIIGDKGSMEFDPFSLRVEVYNNELDFIQPPVDPYDPMGMWGASHPAYAPMPKKRWVPFNVGNVMKDDIDAFINSIDKGTDSSMNAKVAA